jgi:hypothetical protein
VSSIRPVRAVPAFAVSWRGVAPAMAEEGNDTDKAGLTLASSAAESVGDVLARYGTALSSVELGLRGGKFRISHTDNGYAFNMKDVKWAADMSVSGRMNWDQITGTVRARIGFKAERHDGTLAISWNDRDIDAQAKIRGKIDGRDVVASRIAP